MARIWFLKQVEDGCDCNRILVLIGEGKIDTTPLITHRFPLNEIEAYRIFENKLDGVIKSSYIREINKNRICVMKNILIVSNDMCHSRMAQEILNSFGRGMKISTAGIWLEILSLTLFASDGTKWM